MGDLFSPKRQMSFFLILIAISAIIFTHQTAAIFTILLSFTVAFIADSLFIRLRKIKPFVLSASIVSGLIIGLLITPSMPWYYFVIASVLAMASKNFIRFQNRHIFNPAGFGLFITSIIFRSDISWWGVSFQVLKFDFVSILLFLVLLSPGIVSVIELQRYRIVASFLLIYILLLFIFKINLGIDPTVIFFSLVMLPEPMTTPNYPVRQIFFGPFVAISSFLTGSLIFGLLIGNIVFYGLNLILNRTRMNK